ncbi:MAG: GDYXXLXY domain-containing protein [Syntrophales bacterium LBB04]|nr:GDYXXLXY domain-containing protein [Syntrophales bacterium LBB04]
MRSRLAAAVLIQLLILLTIVAYKQYIISTGQRILLPTRLYDPRDMLKGEYVRLSYDFSQFNTSTFGANEQFKKDDAIYVTLRENDNGTYSAEAIGKTAPKGEIFIRGKVKSAYKYPTGTVVIREDSGLKREFSYYWQPYEKEGTRYVFCLDQAGRIISHFAADNNKETMCGSLTKIYGTVERAVRHEDMQVNAEYGIEKYFVEEGKGRHIEKAMISSGVEAVVYVSKDGKAALSSLIVNDKELK